MTKGTLEAVFTAIQVAYGKQRPSIESMMDATGLTREAINLVLDGNPSAKAGAIEKVREVLGI